MLIEKYIIENIEKIKGKFNIKEFELYYDDYFNFHFVKIVNHDVNINSNLKKVAIEISLDTLIRFPGSNVFLTWEDDRIEVSGELLRNYYWNSLNNCFEVVNTLLLNRSSIPRIEQLSFDLEYSYLTMDVIDLAINYSSNKELSNYKTPILNNSDFYKLIIEKNYNLETAKNEIDSENNNFRKLAA